MSEATKQPGTEPVESATPPPQSTPAPDTGTTDAPEQVEEEGERKERDTEGRRVAQVRARLAAAERERDALRAEAEFYRRQTAGIDPANETPEQREARRDMEADARAEAKWTARRFHEDGAAQFGDWKQRCDDLMAMGADANFARLLVEMPGGEGVKVAAALAADPDAVERIANLGSERARAVALGKYAATMDAEDLGLDGGSRRPRAAPPTPVTRAPAPVRPVTGRAAPQFNEYSASPQQLVDFYMRQNLDKQTRR